MSPRNISWWSWDLFMSGRPRQWQWVMPGNSNPIHILKAKVKHIWDIQKKLQDPLLSNDQAYDISGLSNHAIFTAKWNNQKMRLYRVYQEIRDSILHIIIPVNLSAAQYQTLRWINPMIELEKVGKINSVVYKNTNTNILIATILTEYPLHPSFKK
jgi:hypothetical protein